MAHSAIFALEHSDLNAFLFSEIGAGPDGMGVSVVSLLARRGVDPWVEARWLTGQPADAAKAWLVQVIAGAPDSAVTEAEAIIIATRLITLLPARAAWPVPPRPQWLASIRRTLRRLAGKWGR